jgi:hypothetical protein
MKYLRSLGQYPGRTGFECQELDEDFENFMGVRQTGFGKMKFVRHSAEVEGRHPVWDIMPRPLGTDEPEWL